MSAIKIETFREGYGIDQVRETMTVGELINFLEDWDEESPVYLSFDNGYTCGGLTMEMFEEMEEDEERETED